jgi:hypothetical protein
MATIPVCPAAMSKLSRLGVSAINSDSPITDWLGFTSFDPGAFQELLELGDDTNTGSLSSYDAQARLSRIMVDPSYEGHPTAGDWRALLPWILDGTESGAGTFASPYAYALSSLLTRRYVFWDDTIGVWNLKEVCVDTATISASQGDPALKCALQLVGTNYDQTGTFPGGLTADTDAPFIFTDSDAAILINSVPVKCESVSLMVSKNVAKDRFFNSTTIACAVPQNRKVTIAINGYPWGVHSSLFAVGKTTAVPVVVKFTFGAYILTFTMPAVRQHQKAPGARVPAEIKNDWIGAALATASNNELTATLSLSA